MSDTLALSAFLAIPIVLGGIFLALGIRKRPRLSQNEVRFFISQIDTVSRKTPTERIVGYDKILDHVLKSLRYRGTLGEKLKSKPPVLHRYLDDIWELHKIRNRIVHELEKPSEDIERHARNYESILRNILSGS
jgi:hypothetical protein